MDLTPFLGPFALTAGLIVAVGWLWRLHLQADADVRKQRDDNAALARDAIAGTKVVADGQEDLTAAFREFVREQAARGRRGDA